MKKLMSILLTLVMTVCLINLNNSHTKADDNDVNTPFTITATEDGATIVSLNKNGTYSAPTLNISINGAAETSYTYGTSITLTKGQKVTFKSTDGTPTALSQETDKYVNITADNKITASGNIMSLVDGTNFATNIVIPGDYCFCLLFGINTNLTSINDLKLPAETLTGNCYRQMFTGCTGLTSIPLDLLPAETLAENCYLGMFSNCDNLTNIPNLPATNLPDSCYDSMFDQCSNLYTGVSDTQSGDLTEKFTIPTSGTTPTVGTDSFANMFNNCGAGLNTPSSLPATYYRKPTPKPEPEPTPSEPVVKDESCEKVIGPTWHWNNDKGICEEYATVGTATR